MAAVLPNWSGRYSVRRRSVQLGFLTAFAVLPLLDLFRFDFARSRLHLLRQEIWLDEWAILWLALMFAMWIVGAASLVLGRVYCAYACPQTVFSEIAHDLDALGRRWARRLPGGGPRTARTLSLVLVAAVSVGASLLFTGYFAPLPEVVGRFARLDVGPWIGAVGATSALLAFLMFGFVRESFCRSACPYGLLQGVIEDGRSLHVRFDETAGACIDCGACARVCPMDIDIRDGSFQIECTRCGSCVDACDLVLARLKPPRPGLLRFDLEGFSLGSWDLKRVLVGAATVGFGVALGLAVAHRERISLRLSPVYETDGASVNGVESRFLLRAANRTHRPSALALRLEGLPEGASVDGLGDATIPAGEERRFVLVVTLPRTSLTRSVTPFAWIFGTADGDRRFESSFFARGKESS